MEIEVNRQGIILGLLLSCGLTLRSMAAEDDATSIFDGVGYAVSMQGSASSGQTPLWLNANKHGLSSLDDWNGHLRASISRPLDSDSLKRFGLGFMADIAVAAGYTSTLVVQQAYVEGRWLKGVLTIGSKEWPMELKSQSLSSGSQTFGINARPVPQVRLALPDYWTIPLTRGWLSIKGHLAYGKFTDDAWQADFTQKKSRYTEDVLYHGKAGYLRIQKPHAPFSLELGLEMASQFGGTSYVRTTGGTMVAMKNNSGLKAFWDALVPGGEDITEEEYKNVEGNQVGSWVMRLSADYPSWWAAFYADHYFEDHSAMFLLDYDGYGSGSEWNERKHNRYRLYDLKDIMLGIEVRLKRFHWLDNIVVEYLYTKYQSGSIYHDHTMTMSDHIGGLDNYYNHSLFTGWQHWGQVMGNPLYTSPIYNTDGNIQVADNRFVAYHIGLGGEASSRLSYRLLMTFRRGYGTYYAPLQNPSKTFHMMAEATWAPDGRLKGWILKGAFGLDAGYYIQNNYGFQLTISKTGLLNKKK